MMSNPDDSNCNDSKDTMPPRILPKLYSTIDEVENNLLSGRRRQHIEVASNLQSSPSQSSQPIDKASPAAYTQQQQATPPHLFLHFDINETILIGDPAGGDTVTECLNKIIAKSAFVRTDDSDSSSDAPSSDGNNPTSTIKRSPSSGNINASSTHHIKPTHWWDGTPLLLSSSSSVHNSSTPPPLYTGWTWPSNTAPYYRTNYKQYAKQFTTSNNNGHGRVYKPLYDELCDILGIEQVEENESSIDLGGAQKDDEEEEDIFKNFVPSFFHTLQHYFPSTSFAKLSPATATLAPLNDINNAAITTNNLPSSPSKVTLILRTFGTDLPRVAKVISAFAQGNHPIYSKYYNSDLILREDNLFCSKWTYREVMDGNGSTKDAEKENKELVYELHSMTTNPTTTTATTTSQQQQQHEHYLCGDDQILKYIQTQSIVGIQDNYEFWRDANCEPWSGKPVWARARHSDGGSSSSNSQSSNNHHHILLDDNIHNDPMDGAGGIRIPIVDDDSGSTTAATLATCYESLHCEEALSMHGKHLIRVPTIRPLLENDWFIRMIEEARYRLFVEEGE